VIRYVVTNPDGDAVAEGLTSEEAGRLILSYCSHSIKPWGRGWLLRVNGTPRRGVGPGCTREEATEIMLRGVARDARIEDGWPAEARFQPDRESE
jgi:hypothetical protein